MSDINFETDQEEVLDRTANIDKLANKIKDCLLYTSPSPRD